MWRSSLICFFASLIQVNSAPNYDLKSIFQTPVKRNYDQLEILERSSFDSEVPGTCASAAEMPKSVANAQVLLRFGGFDRDKKCACGDSCQCRCPPPCYYPPQIPPYYCMPQYQHPQFLPFYPYHHPPCAHPLHTPTPSVECQPQSIKEELDKPVNSQIIVEDNSQTNQVNIVQNDSVHEGSQVISNTVVKNNHPQILKTVNLADEVIHPSRPHKRITNDQIENDIENFKHVSKKDIINKIEPCRITPNVKFVPVDLGEVPNKHESDIYDLEDALVPHITPQLPHVYPQLPHVSPQLPHVYPQLQQPKFLVSYPIFNRPRFEEGRLPGQYRRGYSYSSGSSYYSDPLKTVICQKPPVLQILGHPRVPVEPTVRKISYICIPVSSTVLPGHGSDCSCSGCAKYVGELNEAGL